MKRRGSERCASDHPSCNVQRSGHGHGAGRKTKKERKTSLAESRLAHKAE